MVTRKATPKKVPKQTQYPQRVRHNSLRAGLHLLLQEPPYECCYPAVGRLAFGGKRSVITHT
jgi:hypothetical protein